MASPLLNKMTIIQWLAAVTIASIYSPVLGQSYAVSFGDPVVNETFGTGTAGSLPAGRTTYRYTAEQCPFDGYYTIASSIDHTCFGTVWQKVGEDHTVGDTNGNMMIVNASYEPDEFYNQTIESLCQGVTYEFSVWVLNVINRSRSVWSCSSVVLDPDVTMSIETLDGTLVQTIHTGTINRTDLPLWKRYAVQFSLPVGQTAVVIKLVNNKTGGCGNDLALDDIQIRPCGPFIKINFLHESSPTLAKCEKDWVVLSAEPTPGYANPGYQWQQSDDGTTWSDIVGATGLTHTVLIRFKKQRQYRIFTAESFNKHRPHCGVYSNALTLIAKPYLTTEWPKDTVVCEGKKLFLKPPIPHNNKTVFTWSTNWDTEKVSIDSPGIYWLKSDSDGCQATDTIVVTFKKCLTPFYVPTAFTPNNDGINDQLDVYIDAAIPFLFQIYNRWGSVIFQSEVSHFKWDGRYLNESCPEGTYTWRLRFRSTGLPGSEQEVTQTGQVLLMR
ncbi:T9SS type B sorting domain-containing protein [Larkinella harenae]